MAVWAEIQYAMLINEKMAAKRMEISSLRKQVNMEEVSDSIMKDILSQNAALINKPTPFQYKNNPL